MISLIIAALIMCVLPMFLLFFFGTNAGVMFLAACAGLVLLGSLDPTVVTTAGAVVPGEGEAYIRLGVVILSIIFAAMIFRHTVKGSTLYMHALVVIFMAGTLWILLPGVTGVSWLMDSTEQSIWSTLHDFRSLIIGAGFASSLFAVITKTKKH